MNKLDFIKIKNICSPKVIIKDKAQTRRKYCTYLSKNKDCVGEDMEKPELSCTAGGNVK